MAADGAAAPSSAVRRRAKISAMPIERTNRIPRPTDRRRSRPGHARPSAAPSSVDVALDLLEQQRLSPMELRILLAIRDRERTESELVRSLGRRTMEVRPSAGALYARGLLRWRYLPNGEGSAFAVTAAGRRALAPIA
jgi:hypothetical protein